MLLYSIVWCTMGLYSIIWYGYPDMMVLGSRSHQWYGILGPHTVSDPQNHLGFGWLGTRNLKYGVLGPFVRFRPLGAEIHEHFFKTAKDHNDGPSGLILINLHSSYTDCITHLRLLPHTPKPIQRKKKPAKALGKAWGGAFLQGPKLRKLKRCWVRRSKVIPPMKGRPW